MKLRMAIAAAAMAVAASFPAAAQGPGYGWGAGYGPGMMGGYGSGMMGGHGPGMMGGYGPGMMHGYGPGYGRGGYGAGPLGLIDLGEDQREKILAVQEDNRQKNWAAMGQMRSEMFKLRRMYSADKLDANALAGQQKKVDELRLQMLKSRVESRNQIEAILTPEQRKQLRQFGHWCLAGDDAQ